MAAGALAPDLDSGGVAAWVRGRPVVVGLVAAVVLLASRSSLASGSGPSRSARRDDRRDPVADARRCGSAWTGAPATEAIIWDLRLPRVLTAMVIGAGLAVAGATFQGLLRNPLADPYVLGHRVGRGARGGDRGPDPGPDRARRVRPPARPRLRRRPAVRRRRLPARRFRWRRRADPPAAHRLRRRVRAGGAPDDGDVRLGRRPAPDLLVPARRTRRGVVGPPRRRGAADHRRLRRS